jgi:hypothetical protein
MKRSTVQLRRGSSHSIAIEMLKKAGKPLTVKEITKEIMSKNPLAGKTPHHTVNAILQRSDLVTRVGKATYALKIDK